MVLAESTGSLSGRKVAIASGVSPTTANDDLSKLSERSAGERMRGRRITTMGRGPILVKPWRLAGPLLLGTALVLTGCDRLVTPEMEARAKAVESVKVSLSNVPDMLTANGAALLNDPKLVRIAVRGDDSEGGLRVDVLLPSPTSYRPADLVWSDTIYGLDEYDTRVTASVMVVGYGSAGSGWQASTTRLASCVSVTAGSDNLQEWEMSNADCPAGLVTAKEQADFISLEVIDAPLDDASRGTRS